MNSIREDEHRDVPLPGLGDLDSERESPAVSLSGCLGGLEGVESARANLLMLLKRERRLRETIQMV